MITLWADDEANWWLWLRTQGATAFI